MRILGLDVGERRIGLAISDPDGQVAVPLRTLHKTEKVDAVATIAALAAKEGVEAIVVGLPLRMDGSVGTQAESVREFVKELLPAVSVPVTLWDERLSTVQAEQLLRNRPGSRKGKTERDALAAAIILQGYLDGTQGKKSGLSDV